MSDKSFIDTNIFLYCHDQDYSEKRNIARDLIFREYESGSCAISTQVLIEFFQNYVVKFGNSYIDAIKEMHFMSRCSVIEQSLSLLMSGISVFSKHSLSVWDAMIIAAAKEADSKILYTEDMRHGQIIEGVKITNPFTMEQI
jgi:predicted nucleic acid-binding protein